MKYFLPNDNMPEFLHSLRREQCRIYFTTFCTVAPLGSPDNESLIETYRLLVFFDFFGQIINFTAKKREKDSATSVFNFNFMQLYVVHNCSSVLLSQVPD